MSPLRTLFAALSLSVLAAAASAQPPGRDSLDAIARDYVRMQLEIGERDEGYVDAYYGPAEWRAAARAAPRSVPELAAAAVALRRRVEAVGADAGTDEARRKDFLLAQLTAAATRLRMVQGERLASPTRRRACTASRWKAC